MRYVGIDSAWGGRNPGAIAQLEDAADGSAVVLHAAPRRLHWPDLVKTVRAWDSEPRLVLVDQPLVVTSETGMRPVERDINEGLVKEFGCGAYPANLANLTCFGPGAGIWKLLDALDDRGFTYDPGAVCRGTVDRAYAEGYPHLALLGLFDLPRVLRYKVHKKQPGEWARMRCLLMSLTKAELLRLDDRVGFIAGATAQTKANEDLIDALLCAYAAAWTRKFKADRSAVLGDAATGAIVTPATGAFRARLRSLLPAVRFDKLMPGPIAVPRPASGAVGPSLGAGAPRAAAPPPGADANGLPDSPEGFMAADLVATDTGNLWRRREGNVVNPWFDRFEGTRLQVCFLEEDGTPIVELVPFSRQGNAQYGMKPSAEHRGVWSALVEGCSLDAPWTTRVAYRFLDA